MRAIFSWYRHAWDIPSELAVLAGLAFATYLWFHPPLTTTEGALVLNALAIMHIRNLLYISLIAGGLHLWLYHWRRQASQDKYEQQFLHRPTSRFSFSHQLYDNMFWTLVSGVTFWTAYEVFILWWHSTHPSLHLDWGDNPFFFIALFLLLVMFESAHFYFIHRLLHVPLFYRLFHALHHRNVNPGPWSGISMHPVEHILYFSSILIHLVIPSHPVHIFFHMYLMTLSPVSGHSGFDTLIIGHKKRVALGHFHHQLHHRHFDCNYGSPEMPWDVWFGSFHNGQVFPKKRRQNT